ncbi:putative repeat protein (TIGR01451 family) [Variovorax sp. 54]|uniref:DUF11 domain-containing protein n=1 Tax=Variovorax sp. 54 TaxID=2035212 RepID=UPI000C1A0889|nr:DUF11 domain-containing protein [Variovorax sp. 54]PIF73227.1 putative repeat protein (TIGR01451 family) [Variovorax sp. 54]
MIPTKPTRRVTGCKPSAPWAGAAALTLGFLFGSPAALAASPPANTVIGNQASASYSDAAGTTQVATSNLVQTTVLQVGSFTLDNVDRITTTVVNTKSGAAGATVYAPHVLTNTGNGVDTFSLTVKADAGKFSRVEVFADADGNGLPDSTTALCTATAADVCTVTPAQSVPGNNGAFRFVVAYTIPGSATGTGDFDKATITAIPGTLALYAAPNISAADKDEVKLATDAVFNVTKSIGAPSVAAPGNGVWPAASASGPRSSAACTPVSWTNGLASTDTCKYTVYTLTFNNTGGAPGKFALSDTLQPGLTYVAGSAVWSGASGTALGDGAAGDPSGIDFQVSGDTVNAVVTSLNPNVTQTLSFVVLVNSSAAVGTSTTTNVARYDAANAPQSVTAAAIGSTLGSSTNPAAYTVLARYSIVVGSNPSTSATGADVTPGTPNPAGQDLTTKLLGVAGGSVRFPQIVFNTGGATDAVNLSISTHTFPSGTSFQFFAAGSGAPLLDTNGDGIPDTGPIPAGGSINIVTQVQLPPSVPANVAYTATVLARSTSDNTKIDATEDRLDRVVDTLVDLTNTKIGTPDPTTNGDLGAGPSPMPTQTHETSPGTGTLFTLWVKNYDDVDAIYNLSASQTTGFPGTLPAGWTVKFVPFGGTCASSAISSISVPTRGQQALEACVTPPSSQAAVAGQKIYFKVQSTAVASTGAIASDVKTDAVTVTATALQKGASLTPNNSGQIAPGGTVVYAHTLTNIGSQSCGAYTLTATVPSADATQGWTTTVYLDVNGDGQIDAGDTPVNGPLTSLAVGAAQKLLVRVFAPGGVSAGVSNTTTVTATFTDPAPNCGTPSATDITAVITGQIRVVKTQAADATCDGVADTALAGTALQLKPGQCIVYQVVATNEGVVPVTNIAINDALPPYTTLSVKQPALQCEAPGIGGTPLAYASTATAVSCGSTANTLAPGGKATLTFAVQINP